jgi:hypothetical protein
MVDYPPFWDLLLNKTLTTMPNDQFPDVPLSEHMSTGQMGTLVLLERTGGIISLIAVMFIFVAFGLAPEVRNVQNTFIVFASVSNVGASVASIIAMDGLMRGRYSPLCQAQGFMFQMYVLRFHILIHSTSPHTLSRLELGHKLSLN